MQRREYRCRRERVIRVVSPPVAGGVSDYGKTISHAAKAEFISFEERGRTSALDIGSGTLFIQVSHYGYQKRGIPLGLLRWLRAQKSSGIRIGFFFHELYAFGPPWTSSFWLSPLQRYITGEMARLSDFWITNRQA